jgi:hypothetical protein
VVLEFYGVDNIIHTSVRAGRMEERQIIIRAASIYVRSQDSRTPPGE